MNESVLLVEAHPKDVSLTLRALQDSGFDDEVAVVRDGAEALGYLLGTNRDLCVLPQLVLLNLELPKVSGLEVLRRLRDDQRTKALPVVMLTIGDPPASPNGHGADGFMRKPVTSDKFVAFARRLGLLRLVPDEALAGRGSRVFEPPQTPPRAALRVLLVEDSEDDAFFLLRELQRDYEVVSERVSTREAFDAVLDNGEGWDVVVCDYDVPGFGALEALELMRKKGLDLPCVIVSGLVGEDKAVEAMRAGAHDFINKSNLARLGPAIERELGEAQVRRARTSAEEELRKSEEQFRVTFEQAAVGIGHTAPDGRWLRANEKLCEILGYSREELLGLTFQQVTYPDGVESDLEHARRLLAGEMETYWVEKRYVRKDGSTLWAELTVSLMREPSGEPNYFIAVIQDISERKRADETLRQKERLYRAVVEQAAENIFLVDVETKLIIEANVALHRSLGYTPEELRQLTLYDILAHDRESVDRNTRRILKGGHTFLGERNYRAKDGRLLNVEVNASVISYEGKEIMCVVAHDVTEHKQVEERLRRSLDSLLALYEASYVLSSSLDSEEIGSRLLKVMQRISKFTTALISTPNEQGRLRVWRAVGFEDLWERARYAPQVQDTLQAVLETGERKVFTLRRPGEHPGEEGEPLVGLCLPLRIRNRSVGLLEAYGPEDLLEEDAVEILSGMANQAASALENARLYGELAEREKRLQALVSKILEAQEEERRRVAYEVHDGLAQVAAAAHQRLQTFARRHPPVSKGGKDDLDRILRLVQKTVGDSRRLIADLRPTVLDDFGLSVALRQEVEELRGDGWQVEYEENIGDERLPAPVETTLFRVAQEALTNVRKHAQTDRVRLALRRWQDAVHLEVRDWGRGFYPDALSNGNGPGERIGLSGMRERVNIMGGEFETRSSPGEGTSITARVAVPALKESEHKEERDER